MIVYSILSIHTLQSTGHRHSSRQPTLKFIHLLPGVAQLLQDTSQLALVLGAHLGAADRLVHARRPAHKQLDPLRLRLREGHLHQLLRHIALAARPARARLVQQVEHLELPRVHVLQVFQLPAQQDVLLAHIAINQRHLRLVRGVAEDLADELVHRRDPRAAGHHADVAVLVGLPLVLGDRALERERLAHAQLVDVRRHRAPGVLLHQQVQVAGLVLVADGRVRPDGRLCVSFALELGQQGRYLKISISPSVIYICVQADEQAM